MKKYSGFRFLVGLAVVAFTSISVEKAIAAVSPNQVQQVKATWMAATFQIKTPNYTTFKTADMGHLFAGQKNCIVRVAPELNNLTGVKMPAGFYEKGESQPLKLKFKEPVKVLLGFFQDKDKVFRQASSDNQLVLDSALTVTGLPPIKVYAVAYPAGTQTINPAGTGLFTVLGVIKASQLLTSRNAGLPDGRGWEPFIVDGFYDNKPLFDIVGGPDKPVVEEGMPGTEGIQGGFEGGAMVKIKGTYHMFPTERAGEKGVPAYFDRVKTRIGHWTSPDAINWTRQSTIYQASGTYALTEDDNPMNDRRGAIWSYMPIFNEEANRWYGYYLAYTVHKEIEPNHSFGRIWRAESEKPGIDGIGGPYTDKGIIMEPGLDSQPWEGRQGVASFFPYKVGEEWLGFYSGAYPFKSWADYPKKTGKGWFIGLAKANKMEGPWTRLDTTVNPVTSMHPWFIENPIVSKLPNGLYIAVFDGGPDGWGHHLPNMMGYSLSNDGYTWSEARYLPIETKVKKWWDIMRTPLGLVPEGNNVYTIVYAAIDLKRRYHPMGMVQVKLNPAVLDIKKQELEKMDGLTGAQNQAKK
ncbi:hypothetical protein [Adhaeribacter rhizoryzae]|uniref:hypothetical protein n=1 Tax=Adhaeribacter rhizoryzae TaxID=2607907 RepID=UPI001CC213A7|nr:hypothetical protein [Adhaeribacter rhizoryzae]